jgi:flagellar biosynthesis protein FlhG
MDNKDFDQATGLRKMIKGESGKIHQLRENNGDRPKVITITSGKGGVGKTNVVVNLAVTCQRMGRKVLIFDADLGLANIDIIFGLNPKHNIEEIIKGEKELSEIILEGPEGVSIIPAGSGVEDLTQLSEGQKMHLLNEFDGLNDMFDLLLVDTAAGISSNVMYFNLAAEERIVVVTPEPTSITDAYALIKVMFHQHGIKNFYLLLNMVQDEKAAKSVYRHLSTVVAQFMGGISLDYVGYIPTDTLLRESVTRREPVVCCYPGASSSQGFKDLATLLLKQTERGPIDGNLKFFWKRLMTQESDQDNAGKD